MTEQKSTKQVSDVRTAVREHYGKAAAQFQPKRASTCCCEPSIDSEKLNAIYETPDVLDLPEEVSGLSMGCGDPVTLASLHPGQTVLDLGSGGGIDCFLAARRVGETGRVIGVDMTAEMIEKARLNKEKLGVENVEFRLGEIENLPAGDNSADVIISNCVINLSPDKQRVLDEAFRVLKPGGHLAVSDIVTDGPLPQPIKDSLSAWAGCISGALDLQEYKQMLLEAGFEQVSVVPQYWDEKIIADTVENLKDQSSGERQSKLVIHDGVETKIIAVEELDIDPKKLTKTIFSARITAVKPAE